MEHRWQLTGIKKCEFFLSSNPLQCMKECKRGSSRLFLYFVTICEMSYQKAIMHELFRGLWPHFFSWKQTKEKISISLGKTKRETRRPVKRASLKTNKLKAKYKKTIDIKKRWMVKNLSLPTQATDTVILKNVDSDFLPIRVCDIPWLVRNDTINDFNGKTSLESPLSLS